MITGQLNSHPHCPVCHRLVNGFTHGIGDEQSPQPGNLSICIYCRSFLVFTEAMQLREMTLEEVAELSAETRGFLIKSRKALRGFLE